MWWVETGDDELLQASSPEGLINLKAFRSHVCRKEEVWPPPRAEQVKDRKEQNWREEVQQDGRWEVHLIRCLGLGVAPNLHSYPRYLSRPVIYPMGHIAVH